MSQARFNSTISLSRSAFAATQKKGGKGGVGEGEGETSVTDDNPQFTSSREKCHPYQQMLLHAAVGLESLSLEAQGEDAPSDGGGQQQAAHGRADGNHQRAVLTLLAVPACKIRNRKEPELLMREPQLSL